VLKDHRWFACDKISELLAPVLLHAIHGKSNGATAGKRLGKAADRDLAKALAFGAGLRNGKDTNGEYAVLGLTMIRRSVVEHRESFFV
jgi:hypothetical protein